MPLGEGSGWGGASANPNFGADNGAPQQDTLNPFAGDATARRTKLLYQYLPRGAMSTGDMAAAAADASTSDSDMLKGARATVKLSAAARYVADANQATDQYEGDSRAMELQQEWEKMSPAEQAHLESIGMKEPLVKKHIDRNPGGGGGILDQLPGGGIVQDAQKDIGGAFHAVKNLAGRALNDSMQAIGAPEKFVQHTWRAGSLLGERGLNDVFYGDTGRYNADYLNQQDGHGIWAELGAAWEDSGAAGGEGSYLDATRRDAYKKSGNSRDHYGMAYFMSTGMSPVDAAMQTAARKLGVKPNDPTLKTNPQWNSTVTDLYQQAQSPRTQAALKVLSDGHMSPGREVARIAGLHEGGNAATDGLFNATSGAVDMAWSIATDPVLIAGKAYEAERSIPYALNADKPSLGMADAMSMDAPSLEEHASSFLPSRDLMHPDYAPALHDAIKSGSINEADAFAIASTDAFKGAQETLPDRLAILQRDILPTKQTKVISWLLDEHQHLQALGADLGKVAETPLEQVAAKDAALTADRFSAESERLSALAENPTTQVAAHPNDLPGQLQVDQLIHNGGEASATASSAPGLDSIERLLKSMDNARAANALTSGAWDSSRFASAQLPNITSAAMTRNRVWANAAELADKMIKAPDALAEMQKFTHYDDLGQLDKVRFRSAPYFDAAKANIQHAAGTMGKLFTQPAFGGAMHIMSPEAGGDFANALRMGMGPSEMWDTWGKFMAAPNAAARRVVASGAMESMMRNLGIDQTAPDLFNDWIHTSGSRQQAYGLGDIADMGPGGAGAHQAALYPSQTADDILTMPSFKDMQSAAAKSEMMRRVEGTVNSPWMDKFMEKAWKPLMIMRIGFAPRVAADELLPWIARDGLSAPLNQWFVQPWHQFQGDNEIPTLLKPIANVERRFHNWNYVQDFADKATEAGDQAAQGLPVRFGDIYNQRGINQVRKAAEQYTKDGASLESRANDILMSVPNKKWAGRFAAYSDDEVKFTKYLQSRLAAATSFAVSDGHMRASEAMTHDPIIHHAFLSDVVSDRAGYLRPKPTSNLLDQMGAPILNSGDGVVRVPMSIDRTEYKPSLKGDQSWDDAVAYHVDNLAADPAGRAIASANQGTHGIDTQQAVADALAPGHNGGDVLLDTNRAYTALPAGVKYRIRQAMEQPRSELTTSIFKDIRQTSRIPEEITHVMDNWEKLDEPTRNALFFDQSPLLRDVSNPAVVRQVHRADQLRGAEPLTPAPGMTQDEFTMAYADAKAKLSMHGAGGLDSLPEMQLPANQVRRLQSRVEALEGRSQGVYQHATGQKLDPALADGQLQGAAENAAEQIDRIQRGLVNDVHERLADHPEAAHIEHEINASLDNIRYGEAVGTPAPVAGEVRHGAISSDRQLLSEHDAELGRLMDELQAVPGVSTMDLQGQLGDVGNRLSHYQDLLRRQESGALYHVQPTSDQFPEALYRAHQDLQTGIAKSEEPLVRGAQVDDPILGAKIRQRESDIEDMAHGDLEAKTRVAKDLTRYHFTSPENNETLQKMERHYATSDGRVQAPQPVDGHIRVYAPAMTPENEQAAVRKLSASTADEASSGPLKGFVGYHRAQDDGFTIEDYLNNAAADNPGQHQPFGSWATTDQAHAQEISDRLHALAGVEPTDGSLVSRNVPTELATQYSPDGIPNNEMFLPVHTVNGMGEFHPSDYASQKEILDDHIDKAVSNMNTMLSKDGKTNYTVAQGIGSGHPKPYHTLYSRNDLLPDEIYGPKMTLAKEGFFEKGVRFGWDKVIGPTLDGIVRTPMFNHNLAKVIGPAEDALRPIWFTGDETAVRAEGIMGEHGGTEAQDIYRQQRSMYRSLKGYYAVPDANIENPVLRASVAGKDAPLNLETLRFADSKGYLPPIFKSYLDSAETRIGGAIDAGGRASIEADINKQLTHVNAYYKKEDGLFHAVNENAMQSALDRTIPGIHDHRIRSQMADTGRNVMPFFWAQEQGTRRWISSIAQNPAFVREAQLAMHGLRSMGMVRKDQYGDDVFVYPGSTALQELVGRAPVFGDAARVAVTIPLTGQVAYTSPTLQDAGVPGVGPVVSIPLRIAANVNPEMAAVRDAVLPAGSENEPFYNELLPPSLARTIHAIGASPTGDRDFAAAQLQTISVMESNNIKLTQEVEKTSAHVQALLNSGATSDEVQAAEAAHNEAINARNESGVPGPGANAAQIDQFLERTSQQTRVLLATKALLGFVGPAAPQADLQTELGTEFKDLVNHLGVQNAYAAFTKAHPEGLPFTVNPSQSISGAALPETGPVGQWMDANKHTIEKYPFAASWLAPHGDGSEPYSAKAAAQQYAIGLRVQKAPVDAYKEMKFKEASGVYFQMEHDFKTAAAQERDPNRAQTINDEWSEWSKDYMAAHQTFAGLLRSPSAATRRANVISDMAALVHDPNTLPSKELDSARLLVAQHEVFTQHMDALAHDRTGKANTEKIKLRNEFSDWGDAFARSHPALASLWEGVYSQEVSPSSLAIDNIRSSRDGTLIDTPIHQTPVARPWSTKASY